MDKLIILYWIIVTATGFMLMGVDKYKAKTRRWRIPESTFLLIACLGGSIGIFAGMYLFRHKTRHKKFTIGIPLILAVQIVLILLCLP